MSQPNPEPGAPEPTAGPAPGAPGETGQGPGTGSGTAEPESNPVDQKLSQEAASWRNKFRALEREHEKLKAAAMSEQDKAIAAAKAEGASEYQAKWRRAVLDNAALTVLAERHVTAPDLALRSLDLSDVDVDDSGKFDAAVLGKRVDDLLSRYPMLAPNQAPPIGTITGADQRRVQAGQIARSAGKSEADQLNELARFALGSGD